MNFISEPSSRQTPKAKTLRDALLEASSINDRGLTFVSASLTTTSRTWAEIAALSAARGLELQRSALTPGARIGVVASDPQDTVLALCGALSAGYVPVMQPPPAPTAAREVYAEQLASSLAAAAAQAVVLPRAMAWVEEPLRLRAPSVVRTWYTEALADLPSATRFPEASVAPDDTCFLQFTSGSTDNPRGVDVSHTNLIANIEAAQRALGSDVETDVGVSWLPLYHDLGLIGSVFTPLVARARGVLIATLAFAVRPRVWIEAIHEYRATITASNNFGLRVATKPRSRPALLDLSCVRAIVLGAEPISAPVVRDFITAFEPFGLRAGALCPSYGLAEATLAVTVSRPGSAFKTVRSPSATALDPASTPELVACGEPIGGHDVMIADGDGNALPSGETGHILVRGPSVTRGYFAQPEASERLFANGWLRTGDLGFVVDGQLYVSGREKDEIIVAGRNYLPQQIEHAVGQLSGIRTDAVAAIAVKASDGERVAIVAECQNPKRIDGLVDEVRGAVLRSSGLKPAIVVLIEPFSLPKTTSGKLQRSRTRALLADDKLPVVTMAALKEQ